MLGFREEYWCKRFSFQLKGFKVGLETTFVEAFVIAAGTVCGTEIAKIPFKAAYDWWARYGQNDVTKDQRIVALQKDFGIKKAQGLKILDLLQQKNLIDIKGQVLEAQSILIEARHGSTSIEDSDLITPDASIRARKKVQDDSSGEYVKVNPGGKVEVANKKIKVQS